MTETCKDCKFFVPAVIDAEGWQTVQPACRRYPTLLLKHPTDWCGEFAPSRATSMSDMWRLVTQQQEMDARRGPGGPKE